MFVFKVHIGSHQDGGNKKKMIFDAKHDHVVLRHGRVAKIKNEDEETQACISQEVFL